MLGNAFEPKHSQNNGPLTFGLEGPLSQEGPNPSASLFTSCLTRKHLMYLNDIFLNKIFSTRRKGSYIFEVEHYIPKCLSM
jgi:hypothetical protein